MGEIYFCTNRNPIRTSIPNNFGTDFNSDPAMVTFGRANVVDVGREDDLSAANIVVDELSTGGFSAAVLDAIYGGPPHLVLSVHGFDYRFREAVMRTAWLAQWYRGGTPALDASFVLFSWPSLGSLTLDAYRADWVRAGESAGAFRLFFQAMMPVIAEVRRRDPARRVSLMAHSMGNHALAAGLGASIGVLPGQMRLGTEPVFDRVLLFASDESSDSLSRPDGLGALRALAGRTCVYYNNQDVPLRVFSTPVHGISRLGIDGPPDKPSFRGLNYTFLNCSAANPGDNDNPVDPQRHHYYRLIPEVRDDICGEVLAVADDHFLYRTLREAENYYRLDCVDRGGAALDYP